MFSRPSPSESYQHPQTLKKKISGLSTNKNSEQSLCNKNTLQCTAYTKTIGSEDNSTCSDYNISLHIVKIY